MQDSKFPWTFFSCAYSAIGNFAIFFSDSTISTPAHSTSPRKTELNGVKRTARNGASSVGTSEDGEESSSVPDEDDDVSSIVEQLSNVQLPQVSEITSRGKYSCDLLLCVEIA